MRYFQVRFLEEANEFLASLDPKAVKKLIYNIDLAEQTNDPRLFKKLKDEIWEFRVRNLNKQIRLLAFVDTAERQNTLVIATHGFITKVDKVSANEIKTDINRRKHYFDSKS